MNNDKKLGTTEETNRLLGGEYFDTQTGKQLMDFNPIISSESVRDERAMDIAPTAPSTASAGLQGMLEANTEMFTKKLENDAKVKESQADKAHQDLISSVLGSEGEISRTDRLYSREGGVDDIETELNKINQDIILEQRSLQKQIEEIEKNARGLETSAVSDEIDRVKTESLRRQADLSIIQMGIQGRYDSAKAIADRAVAVQLEKQKNVNDALKLNYERNQDLFSTSEQRAFESAQADRERALDEEKTAKTRAYELGIEVLKNGGGSALAQQVMQAKTEDEALALAGNYVGLLDRQKALIDSGTTGVIGQPGTRPNGKPDPISAGYANRTLAAHKTINDLGAKFTAVSSYFGQFAPNPLKSSERQQFEQAQRNFINAVLRRESGAAIAESEFENARMQYFPQPGDTKEVIAQKSANRVDAINSLIGAAGRAFDGEYLASPTVETDAKNDPLNLGLELNPLGI